jgi:hypothetical protein
MGLLLKLTKKLVLRFTGLKTFLRARNALKNVLNAYGHA